MASSRVGSSNANAVERATLAIHSQGSERTLLPRLGPGFLYVRDGSPSIACGPRSIASKAMRERVTAIEQAMGLDVELIIVFATHPTGCDDLYYVPVQNNIRGIGYAHTNGSEVFDEDESTQLDGFVFMNDMPYWERNVSEFRTAFLHEVGHRWGARVGALVGNEEISLTGRQGGHWSYYLDSNGSPLEGNEFASDKPFRTSTNSLRLEYSPLDLYLMGLIGPDEVGPIRLLTESSVDGTDCAGQRITAASPPQICEEKVLPGRFLELRSFDVIAREGERIPAYTDAPRTITAAFIVLGNNDEPWDESSCEAVQAAIPERLNDFERATSGRMRMLNAVTSTSSCRNLVDSDGFDYNAYGGCSFAEESPESDRTVLWGIVLLTLGAIRRRLRG